jgi:hypothetical protein
MKAAPSSGGLRRDRVLWLEEGLEGKRHALAEECSLLEEICAVA